ncbi:U4/U6-U5 snRNP complex subunit prp31 [Dipsacomyces acuminosporus]|nr:U4/U6-U5 snRNP complex subunit prp31 [Dipsacomyces acuminosporus]
MLLASLPLLVDGDRRVSKVKRWLSKVSKVDAWPSSASPTAVSAAAGTGATTLPGYRAEAEPSIADDATLYTLPSVSQRNRALSSTSEDSTGSMPLSYYSPSANASTPQLHQQLQLHQQQSMAAQTAMPVINAAQVDTAMAMLIRAKQEDRMGNSEVAARLFVGALEHTSSALQDPMQVKDAFVRERLTMLKLMLESGDHTPSQSHSIDYKHAFACEVSSLTTLSAGVGTRDGSDSSCGPAAVAAYYPSQGAMNRAVHNIRTSVQIAAARILELAHQLLILWLVFLGNLFMWAAVQFKNSQLPELAGRCLVKLGVWSYDMCIALNVPEHAVRYGKIAMAWAVSLDKETHFSQKMLSSCASILGAIALLASVRQANIPQPKLVDLYEQIIVELVESRDMGSARALLRQTEPMEIMRAAEPDRYLSLEQLLSRTAFDAGHIYKGRGKEARRLEIAEGLLSEINTTAPSRLLTLLGQAIKWQQENGLLTPGERYDLFYGRAQAIEASDDKMPTRLQATIKFPKKQHPDSLAFSPNGEYLATGSADGFIELWNYMTGKLCSDLKFQAEGALMMMEESVTSLSFSHTSELVCSGAKDGKIKVWSVKTGSCVKRLPAAHSQGVTCVAFSRDDTQILSGGFDSLLRIHGLKSGKVLKEFRGHTAYITSAVFSEDTTRILSTSEDGSVRIWNTESATCLHTIVPDEASSGLSIPATHSVLAIPGSPSDFVVCTKSPTLYIVGIDGKTKSKFAAKEGTCREFLTAAVTPKGKYVLAVSDTSVLHCFNIATGLLEGEVKVSETEVVGMACHPSTNIAAFFSSHRHIPVCKALQQLLAELTEYQGAPASEKQVVGRIEDDPGYQLMVRANDMSSGIASEIAAVYQFALGHYKVRFPELETLVRNPVDYARTVKAIGNAADITKVSLDGILPNATRMVVTVTGSTTAGRQLSSEELRRVEDACDCILELASAKSKIVGFIESRMPVIAPNLAAVIGSASAAKLIVEAGGLTALSKIPACNIQILGKAQHASSGLSSISTKKHVGIIYYSDVVSSVPEDFRIKMMRKISAKCALAARVDAQHESADGAMGKKFRADLDAQVEKLLEAAPVNAVKPLPVPDVGPKARRAGRKVRKAREPYTMTELRKQRDRLQFGKFQEEAVVMDEMEGLGMMGQTVGRVRATQANKAKAKVAKKYQRYLQEPSSSSNPSGIASLAFTPVQGFELADPQAAVHQRKKAKLGADKYFASSTPFMGKRESK